VEYTANTLQTFTPDILQIEIRVISRFLVVILRGRAKSSIVSKLASFSALLRQQVLHRFQ
jgi:hypothetical protein